MQFSVIIPAYNAAKTIARAIASVPTSAELIVIDDCSTDDTFKIAHSLLASRPHTLIRHGSNDGPGPSRNDGLKSAEGDWVVFLDADDELAYGALDMIAMESKRAPCDLVVYNWVAAGEVGLRRTDMAAVRGSYLDRLSSYLKLQMDGSVIFSAFRHSMIVEHEMKFVKGLHEDVEFMFHAYTVGTRLAVFDQPLYIRHFHDEQITATITPDHLVGFFQAWAEIGRRVNAENFKADYAQGCVALVATRLREIAVKVSALNDQRALYETLRRLLFMNPTIAKACLNARGETKYEKLVKYFILSGNVTTVQGAKGITVGLMRIINSSWSCNDLQGSIFLGPDEARACCKRFFVNGEQRGDVVLLGEGDEVNLGAILGAKRSLLSAINSGASTQCDGCPHKEFKVWPEQQHLTLLSMEHHSICNMRCSYCSDKYYGGKGASYDVIALTNDMVEHKMLGHKTTVVWGGGEPTLGRDFERLTYQFAHCDAQQRILTNAYTPHNEDVVKELLLTGVATVVTSIDAGTEATFQSVRGVKGIDKVWNRIEEYASIDASRVTIKYILTSENFDDENIDGFVTTVDLRNLSHCNFQLSCNFEQETMTRGQAMAVTSLYGGLLALGVQILFCDDLLRQRIVGQGFWSRAQGIADPLKTPRVVLYGAGQMANLLLNRSEFFKKAQAALIADDTDKKYAQMHVALASGLPLIIAASQGYAEIHNKLMRGGCDPKRIVRELIL